jgi:peptide/nickel transport system ATP-binding protein
MTRQAQPVIEVAGLTVEYWSQRGWLEVVSDVTLAIAPGEILGVAGESGCGKSTVAYAMLAERRTGSRILRGSVRFEGRDLLRLDEAALCGIRGARIGFVPQNPTTSLTPSMTCGQQIREVLDQHRAGGGSGAMAAAHELMDLVGLPDPATTGKKYPHQLSGGQQQRVVIAMALACRPALVVLDEPTTGLDVTTQWRILSLLREVRDRFGTALLYVSHDLGALAQVCDRVAVMYAGRIVETAPTEALFAAPRHPYSRGLLASLPRVDRPPGEAAGLRGMLRRDEMPEGCRFAPRCDFAEPSCWTTEQRLEPREAPHAAACRRQRDRAVVDAVGRGGHYA